MTYEMSVDADGHKFLKRKSTRTIVEGSSFGCLLTVSPRAKLNPMITTFFNTALKWCYEKKARQFVPIV
jgi:hypothetical protein